MPITPDTPFLYSFDFDGTLVNIKDDHQTELDMLAWLQTIADNPAKKWVINTGRDLPYLLEGLEHAGFTTLPDYVICRERDLYERCTSADGKHHYVPHTEWNQQCEHHINKTINEARGLIDRFKRFLKESTQAEWLEFPGDPAGVRAESSEEMDRIVEWVDQQMHLVPALGYQRNSIWMRFGDHRYQKGSTTQHLAELLNIPKEQCLTAGDGDNDLTMLHQEVAKYIIAPSNSNFQVQQAVKKQNGYLAKEPAALGVLEGIQEFGLL